MARIRLDLPEDLPFRTEITVRIGDINYGGHLANDAVLAIVHEARLRFLRSFGFSEQDVGGAGIIMADAAVVYRAEAFYGQTLVVGVGAGEFTRTGCDVFYRLTDLDTGKEVALAKTGIVFFDYGVRKPVAVPDAFGAVLDG